MEEVLVKKISAEKVAEDLVSVEVADLFLKKFHYKDDQKLTQAFVQKCLRELYGIHILIGFRPNIKKWDSHPYLISLNVEEYLKEMPLLKFSSQKLYDSYNKALEAGLYYALEKIKIDI